MILYGILLVMNLALIGLAMGTFGEILVVLAVLHMHHSLIVEHKVDKVVILSYQQERIITVIGLLLIIIGFILEMGAH